MRPCKIALIAAAVLIPHSLHASEAFLTQVSAGPATVTLNAPAAADVASVVSQLELTTPTVSTSVEMPDLSSYAIPAIVSGGSIAEISSVGNDNTATIVQTGFHAGLIQQTGNMNTASLVQSGQANRAAIYQTGSNMIAVAVQSGSNNTGLIVQK